MSELQRCPKCGTNLYKRNGRMFCPNHGIIDDMEEDNEDKERSYLE